MSERRKREFKHTKGPWRAAKGGTFGSLIEGQSGRKSRKEDDGYRIVASFQSACSPMLHADEEENQAANGRLIIAAPAMLDLLVRREEWLASKELDWHESIAINREVKVLLDYIEKGDA